ncbi:MAG: UvrD-helicase domain-containing protein [Syntrophorhabdaceae bacterium]|nr:UvrD-helicase domain-containing protein [Syntrophorhabdaceae bacterium]
MFPQIVTVKSSAGSGKTYSLAKRYMGLLLLEIMGLTPVKTRVSSIVAITFTNKAASEMQGRIIDWMKRIILNKTIGGFSIDPVEEAIKEIPDEKANHIPRSYIRDKVGEIFEDLIKDYHDFKVCTIDSFVNLTLKASAFKLGLKPDFDISMESSLYIDAVIQRMLKEVIADGRLKEKFERFLEDYLTTEGERASWFPKKIIRDVIITLWREETKDNRPFIIKNDIPEIDSLLKEIRTKSLELLKSILSNESLKFEKRFIDALEECALSKGYDFLKSAYLKRSSLSKMTTKKSIVPDQALEGMWREIQGSVSRLVEAFSLSKFSPYLELYLEFKKRFSREVINLKRTVLIEQLNMLLQRIIEDEYFIPEIYYALADRYTHFLVDEFQDTNHLQWKNIEVLAEEAIARGGTLFLVGDKKQAIYQWRGGKADLVDEIAKKYSKYAGEEYVLDLNFRSWEEIVRFNNTLFNRQYLQRLIDMVIGHVTEGEREKILAPYTCPAQRVYEPNMGKGYVYIEKIVMEGEDGDRKERFNKKEGKELIKDRLLALIKRIEQRGVYPLKDITILVRKREEAQYISRILLESSIDVDSEFTVNIKNNPLIKEVISFLKFVDSVDDNISFAGFLLGEIFEKKTGFGRDSMAEWIADKRVNGKKDPLYREFQEDFKALWEGLFEHLFKSAGYMPTYEFIVLFLKKWEVFQLFPDHAPFLLHLCELVKNREASGENSINSFLQFWGNDEDDPDSTNNEQEKLFLLKRSESLNAVKVMTIHKAKGLQSPVVILPFLKLTSFETSDGRDKTKFFVDDGEGKRLLYIKKDYLHHSEWLADIYRKRQIDFLLEEINNIYVASTRAKEEMYLFLMDSERQKNYLIEYIFNIEAFKPFTKENTIEIGKPSSGDGSYIQGVSHTIFKNPSLTDIGQDIGWMDYIKKRSEDSIKPSAESIYAKTKGDAIHHILSLIKELPEAGEMDFVDFCIKKGLSRFNTIHDREEIEETIKNIFLDERTKRFFTGRPYGETYTEKEVIDAKGKAFKIDRLIVDHKKTIVIDFKTGESRTEEHITQINRYREVIETLYPDRPSEGYLIYLDRDLREVIPV